MSTGPATLLSDSELVTRARGGDPAALEQLVARHQMPIRALGYSLVGDWEEAEDLSQEAFLRAFRNLDLLADPSSFAPWLRRVMFGVCIDWVRAFRPQLYRYATPGDEAHTLEARSDDPSPLEQLERRDLAERILCALRELPPRYRTPLTLYHIDGLSHEKVARALDVPVGTVRSLVSRARRKLASALVALGEGREEPTMESREQDVLSERALAPRMLHVLNGDATREKMERSEIPGTLAVWADVLHEGPVPADLDDEHFREVRARYGSSRGWGTIEEVAEHQRRWDSALGAYADYEEVVLWFEHDLFDQLILIRHLDWYARRGMGDTALSLICVGEFAGVEPFHGLGQLSPDQLASLLGTRQPVTVRQTELARRAWKAFTSADPTSIERMLERDTSALPFLAGALSRFLEEYPDVRTGLPRTERQILELLARGMTSPVDLFRASQTLEERVFMGDWTFWSRLKDLTRGPHPLVELSGTIQRESLPQGTVRLTDTGRRVLAGDADWIALDGIDRWLGGAHLQGRAVPWRWDPRERRLVSPAR